MRRIESVDRIRLDYLNHHLRNNIVIIAGLLKQIESSLAIMMDAVKAYEKEVYGDGKKNV